MNILNNLTIKNLKLNKKRTIVTIIGIILSSALICAVAGMVSSFQATLIHEAKQAEGNRHLTIEGVNQSDLKYFENNNNIKSTYLIENLGYANLEGSKNDAKPYLYLKGYTKEAFEESPVKLIAGRLPNDEFELVISDTVLKNAQVKLSIGDTLKLDIGNRVCSDGSILNQNNPYITDNIRKNSSDEFCQESLDTKYTKEYKIVGIMERLSYSIEGYSAPGYTALTYTKEVKENIDVNILLKNSKNYKEYVKNLQSSENLGKYNISLNQDLLRWEGVSLSDSNVSMLIYVAAVVIGIIILTSIFVIKNSFDISIVEKTKQYGMLSSVGATSKQIKKNVLFEGFILGIIGIPIGILCGIFADFCLVQIINIIGASVFGDIKFVFNVPILPIILSIVLGSATIFLSVIKTARKTSKISPIVAIRNNNEIKVKRSKLKTPKIIGKVFGIGGEIAYKNLKRSKKKYRTTVISIVVSVSVFIALSSFIGYGFKIAGQYYTDYAYDLRLYIKNDSSKSKEIYEEIKKMDSVETSSFMRTSYLKINAQDYMSKESFFRRYGTNNANEIDAKNLELSIDLKALGKESYEKYLKEFNIDELAKNTGILLDDNVTYDSKTEKYVHENTYDLKNKVFKGNIEKDDKQNPLEIEILKRADKRPMGLENLYNDAGFIIISDELMDEIGEKTAPEIFIKSTDPDTLETDIKTILAKYPEVTEYYITNIAKEADAQRSMIILVSIFLYGFIIVISLIGVTNIFNTLTTNMNLRRKEFAMLKSIGMTKNEFNKMIRLESLMYGTKALLIGIPLGLLGSFGIYKAFSEGSEMNFMIPYTAIIISAVAVYLLVGLIMHFSLKKTEKQNIIETIRNDNI